MTGPQAPSGIVTPEAVVLEFDTAGAGSRLIGEFLDIVLQLFLLFGMLLGVAFIGAGFGAADLGWIAIALMFILGFLIILGYPVAMETLWNGRTLGKAAMGLRVVTEEGGPIRFRHAAIRGIVGLFEIWVFQGLVALVAIIVSPKDQRLGDMLAGTIVLRERTATTQTAAVAFPSPPGYESYVGSLDVSSLTTDQYGVVRSFLMRVFELTPPARATLALRLANPVAVQIRHTPPPTVGPELFLACVASAYQLRHGGPARPWVHQGVPPPAHGAPPPGYFGQPPAYPGAYGAPAAPPAYGGQPGYGGAPTGYGPPAPGYGARPGFGSQPGQGPPAPGYGGSDPNAVPFTSPQGSSYGNPGRDRAEAPGRYGDHGSYGARASVPSVPPSSPAAFGRGTLRDEPPEPPKPPGPPEPPDDGTV